ncbi:MAG: YceI family protein [Saprospiraceae bacterium]
MNKLNLSFLMIAGLLVSVAFTKPNTKKVDVAKSKVGWVAKKVTGQHSGIVSLQSGSIVFDNNRPVSGNLVMDMNSIKVTDLQGEYAEKLRGHLNGKDFFDVENNPTANFVLKNSAATADPKKFVITGDLTIKGITQSVSFDAMFEMDHATANIMIDRTKFGIKYGSGTFFQNLGDKAINDVFDLNVDLVFSK